jgi:peptide/nickel transport system substrate-binding protein
MRFIALRRIAAISWLCLCLCARFVAPSAEAGAARPRYGGTLRVELHTASVSLDPRTWRIGSLEAAADEKLAALVFERLVALDDYGRFQPVLATGWSHDASFKRWQFTLRSGVRFSDGSELHSSDVVAALQPLLPESLQISASSGDTVVIQSSTPVADLLEELASGRYFVYRVQPDGSLLGTGAFVKKESAGAADGPSNSVFAHLVFRANEESWEGRPFVDAVDVTLGVPPLRAMFDLQLGKADLIELAPDLVPRGRQANLRIWSSDPVVLYGLRFDDAQAAAADPRLRQALSLALDRGTMANVLLQKQAQPAAALLPQWLSGYAFLFSVEANLERAKELRRSLSASAGGDPLRLRVEPAGDLPKLLGERVAVNARQAAIAVQVVNLSGQRDSAGSASSLVQAASGVHLFAWRYSSLSPRAELDAMLTAYNLGEASDASSSATDREQLYAREYRVLEDWRVLPLVEQAESVAIGPSVRDWMPARWGEWRLADVWLDLPETAQSDDSRPANDNLRPDRKAPAAGVKP